jgi:hypothetical protein
MAMDCGKRAQVVIAGPFLAGGRITLMPSHNDPEIGGVLRKLSAQLSARCARCGTPARQRKLVRKVLPLCSRCYAIRALRLEAGLLSRSLEQCSGDTDLLRTKRFALSPRMLVAMDPERIWSAAGRWRIDGSLELPANMLASGTDRLAALRQCLNRLVHDHRRHP